MQFEHICTANGNSPVLLDALLLASLLLVLLGASKKYINTVTPPDFSRHSRPGVKAHQCLYEYEFISNPHLMGLPFVLYLAHAR